MITQYYPYHSPWKRAHCGRALSVFGDGDCHDHAFLSSFSVRRLEGRCWRTCLALCTGWRSVDSTTESYFEGPEKINGHCVMRNSHIMITLETNKATNSDDNPISLPAYFGSVVFKEHWWMLGQQISNHYAWQGFEHWKFEIYTS